MSGASFVRVRPNGFRQCAPRRSWGSFFYKTDGMVSALRLNCSMGQASAEHKTILVVDDNDDLRELYGTTLRRAGFVVSEAENGEVALAVLEHSKVAPSLLLLDLMMPVMNGVELMRVLHDSGRLAGLPVIVLTAGGRPSDVPGANKFIRKPVDACLLLELVRELCSSRPSA